MANLAIKGHEIRGKEVIEILEMLGGRNLHLQSGCGNGIYLINTRDNIIYFNQPKDIIYDFIILTLEEFLEKFPYKVGDKVTIEKYKQIFEILSVRWCTERNIIMYQTSNGWYCADKLQPYKEETVEVSEEFYNKYCVNCGSQRCTAEGEWLEECRHYKEETMYKANKAVFDANAQCCDIMNHLIKEETMEETIKIDIPKGYEFAGVDDDNQQVVFAKIQPEYPKTYEGCCNILKYSGNYYISLASKIDDRLFEAFYKLKVCRDAYWKIASEQMGLGEPWKPNTCQVVYAIGRYSNEIVSHNDSYGGFFILEFPTKEMRDAFYENFKDWIEQCKELL